MARKFYGEQVFTATVSDGTEYTFVCKGQDTSYGFRHVCTDGYFGDIVAKACYYNRTWESFRYETVLQQAIEKQPKEHREDLTAILIKGEQIRVQKECDDFLNTFTAVHNSLSDENKEILKKHAPLLETQEQAESMLNTMKLMKAFEVVQDLTSKDK